MRPFQILPKLENETLAIDTRLRYSNKMEPPYSLPNDTSMLLKQTRKDSCARMKRFFEEAENYSNDKNVYKEVPSIQAYIEPSQASMMELFYLKKPSTILT